jgi:hypothetical protein
MLADWKAWAAWVQAIASVVAVGLSVPALYIGIENRNRAQPDQLEIGDPTLGLYNAAKGQWQTYRRPNEMAAPILITDDQWLASTSQGRHFSVRLYNGGFQEIYLNAMGLITSEDEKTRWRTNFRSMEQACGPAFDRLAQCPDSLSAGKAMIVQYTLSEELLREFDEKYRNQPLIFTVEMGSGSKYYTSGISLPAAAFA